LIYAASEAEMTGPARTPQGLNVEKYRLRLQEMQAQLELDISNQRQDAVEQDGGPGEPGPGQHWEHSGYGDHQADDGTELFEREKLLSLERTLQDHLRLVREALRRIEEGAYGACEVCGRPIGEERLDVIPETALCIEHKAAAERKLASGGGQPVPNAYRLET
jgi:RNA polymerase-binding transcription factor DksA